MTSVMVTEVVEHLSPADEKRIERLLAKARTALVLEHPFIGNRSEEHTSELQSLA